jgi:hypothetical protein
VINIVIIALFGLVILGLVLDAVHESIRRTEDAERAADRHRRLMGEIRRHR